jgi:hypothetical protein
VRCWKRGDQRAEFHAAGLHGIGSQSEKTQIGEARFDDKRQLDRC